MDKKVFVAIQFDQTFEKIYKSAIEPAMIELNFEPFKTNQIPKNSQILNDIEDGIRNSPFILADITGSNPNVIYEVGFAHGIGKKVIAMTHSTVSFDLSQRRYIFYENSPRGLKVLKEKIKQWVNELVNNAVEHNIIPKAVVHGTKFDVPNRNDFWNNLLKNAKYKFILLGGSNKSWINKSASQSHELGQSIYSIICNGGSVLLISDKRPKVIRKHKKFISTYILSKIEEAKMESFKSSFTYAVVAHSNYQAIISDNRIVLLPKMNSLEFKDESLVIELEGSHFAHLKNYSNDIERLLEMEGCSKIDLFKK